jgi:hypothetical protein
MTFNYSTNTTAGQEVNAVGFFVKPFQASVDGPAYVLPEIGDTPLSLNAVTNAARLCFE